MKSSYEEGKEPSKERNMESNKDNEVLLNIMSIDNAKVNKIFETSKCTKEEIKHKRNIAKIRRIDSKNRNNFKEWFEDVFFPITSWPPYAVEVLLSEDFTYQDRLVLATFFHGNGLFDEKMAHKIVTFYNIYSSKYDWKQKLYKFSKLWVYLNKTNDMNDPDYSRIRSTYYYYCIRSMRMIYYDGSLRSSNIAYKK